MREVETGFMPWLKEQAMQYLARGVVARKVGAAQPAAAHASALMHATRNAPGPHSAMRTHGSQRRARHIRTHPARTPRVTTRTVLYAQVVDQLVKDAAVALEASKAAKADTVARHAKLAAEFEQRQAALEAQLSGAEAEAVRRRPTFVLRQLTPAVASAEAIEAATAELTAAAGAAADEAYAAAQAEAADK